MTTIEVKLPRPFEAQRAILNSPARFRVIRCGRRFGKTNISRIEVTKAVLRGEWWAYFSPTYKNIGEFWRDTSQTLTPVKKYKNETDKRFEAVTGGGFECWSLDAIDTMRGRKYHGIIVDEAAYVKQLEKAWTKSLMPMLADYRGRALFPSTPNGYDYFYTLCMLGMDELNADWAHFHYTTLDNPYIPPEEVELARNTVPQRAFLQEYMAEFVEDAGGVFRNVSEVHTGAIMQPYAGKFVIGVDWGRSNDFTVLSVWDADKAIEVDIDRFNQISWELQRERLKSMYNKWGAQFIVAEANSIGDVNIEALQRDGLPVVPFTTTSKTKAPLIDAFSVAVERQEIALVDYPSAKAEMQSYQLERLPSGMFRYTAPSGGHDDSVIARALGYYGISIPTQIFEPILI